MKMVLLPLLAFTVFICPYIASKSAWDDIESNSIFKDDWDEEKWQASLRTPLHSKNFKPQYWTCDPRNNITAKFCDASLTNEERVADLLSYMSLDLKLSHFVINMVALEDLQVKAFHWDVTCIQGVDWPNRGDVNVTVFPNAIAQGATFDPSLTAMVANATAFELRALRHANDSGIAGVCDGGPLANTAHDPRWGRNSETYGEDPHLSSLMGVTAINSLQKRTMFNGKEFILAPQVTRHYLGFHGAHPDCDGTMHVDQKNLEESYFPIYEDYQVKGKAAGIMCSYAFVNGVPSCGNEYMLKTKLRDAWKSDAIIQSDCCDSVSSMTDHGYVENAQEALNLAVNTGLQLMYGYRRKEYMGHFNDSLKEGDLKMEQLDAAVSRILLTRFRMGEFDDIPWNDLPEGVLMSDYHTKIARDVGAASVVLLKNEGNLLPLNPSKYKRIAVIGPFAHCTEQNRRGGYGCKNCYSHTYSGNAETITTIYDAFTEVGKAHGIDVVYALGSNATDGDDIANAVKAAKTADLVVLCLGLGADVEAESRDRTNLYLPDIQQQLLSAISALNLPMVASLTSAGGIDFPYDKFKGAILQTWYGGQSAGYSVTDVSFGDVVPSGRLPLTIYKNETLAMIPNITRFNIDEGVGRTYRYVNPDYTLFGFGYGLSYTTFSYSDLTVSASDSNVELSFKITNTGSFGANEVYQVYVSNPDVYGVLTPRYSLRSFGRALIPKGDMKTIQLSFAVDDLETVLNDGSRQLTKGTYTFYVGGSQPNERNPTTSGKSLNATLAL